MSSAGPRRRRRPNGATTMLSHMPKFMRTKKQGRELIHDDFTRTDLGKLKTIQHTINTGESSPIRVPTRRLPYHRMEEARREIEAMLASDVIEESDSPWSAPVVMVSMMSWKPFQVQLSLLTWTLSVVTGKSEWMKEIERNGILYSRRSLPI